MTQQADGPWRILTVDDDALIVTLVADALRTHGHDVRVAASPSDAQGALAELDPHVLVCDLNFVDGQSGAEFVSHVRSERPWVACVVLSNHRSPELAVGDAHLLPNDVVYLVKSTVRSVDHILEAVHSAMTGNALPPHDEASTSGTFAVNAAQAQVLRMLASGASTRAVADARRTSIRAVESLLVRLYATLELDTSPDSNPRVDAVRIWQAGLVRVRKTRAKERDRVS
jgi:DNA-binding NarL/FixJ family response regulator